MSKGKRPADVTFSKTSVAENAVGGSVVATLGATDAKGKGVAATYTLGGDDAALFQIVGNQIVLKSGVTLDHETAANLDLTVTATNKRGSITEAVTISVTDVNEAPTDIALLGGSISEAAVAGTVAAVLVGTDPEGDPLTYSIVGGTGATKFGITGSQVVLNTGAGLNFDEASSYTLVVRATDASGNSYNETVTIGVTDSSLNNTFVLTSGLDTGASFTGSSGNDTYNGVIATDRGAGTTYGPGDNLNGGSGTDTLSVSVTGTHTAAQTHSVVTLNAVEKVLVSNFETSVNNDTFDASLWTGVTTVGLSSSSATGDTSFINLKNIVAAEMGYGAGDLTVDILDTAVTGTADSQELTVSGVTAGTFATDAGIETVAITASTVDSTLTALTAAGATKLTVAGDKGLTIGTALNTAIKTIDASANTGGVSVILGTADLTVTGGAGNDTVRIDGSTVDTNDSINAGNGTDTLQLTGAVGSSTAGAKLVGFENLYIYQDTSTTNATVTQNVSFVSGITKVGVTKMTYTDDDDGTVDAATVTSAFTGMSATQTGSISGITSAGDANDTGTLTAVVTFALAADTTADSGTITLGTATAAAAVAGANNPIILDVTASDYETLSLVSQGGTNAIGTLTAADATTLNINASKALTITTLSAGALKTIDASASTANVTVGATSVASTITGGAGNDTFTGSGQADSITGGAGNDTLDGGAGNDVVIGGAGNDSITGGAGNDNLQGGDGDDTFADSTTGDNKVDGGAGNDTFVTTLANLTSADTIAGGDGTDTIRFSDAADVNLTTDLTKLSNVSSVEVIGFTGLNGSDTVTVNDGAVSSASNSLTLQFLTGVTNANTINASGVLNSASTVNVIDLAGLATTYSISNAKDVVTLLDGNDGITISNAAFLSSSDTIDGGSGTDTATFTSTANSTFGSQLGGLKNVEALQINTGGAGDYVFTLTDAIVGAQVTTGSTFTVSRLLGDNNGATLKVDGSAVSSAYNLALTGQADATSAQTLIGGAGNDTITSGTGADSLTGGAGNDTFQLNNTASRATITDVNFGTSTTSVDVIKLDNSDLGGHVSLDTDIDTVTVVTSGVAGINGTSDIVIFNSQAFADSAALDTVIEDLNAGTVSQSFVAIYQDTLGGVRLALVDSDGVENGGVDFTVVDLATLSGVTLTGLVSSVNTTDFSFIA